jgi:hypothetical protein
LIPTEEYVTPDTRLWRVGDADETEAKIRSPNDMRDNIGETLWVGQKPAPDYICGLTVQAWFGTR